MIKNLPANAGDVGSVPGLGRSPGEGRGNPLQSPCLENYTDREGWGAAVRGAAEADTAERLKDNSRSKSLGAGGTEQQPGARTQHARRAGCRGMWQLQTQTETSVLYW